MIPVLGVPAISPGRMNEMFASVDYPIGDLVFVDNSPDGLPTPSVPNAPVERLWHLRMPSNLGVATSWNLIVKSTPFAPWWLIAPTDLVWKPGALERIASEVPDDGVLTGGGSIDWAWFALPEQTVMRVGLFDEYFHPIYFEDNDYHGRVVAAGMSVIRHPGDLTHHWNSTTISRDGYSSHNRRTFHRNKEYFRSKPLGPGLGWDLSRRREQSWDGPR